MRTILLSLLLLGSSSFLEAQQQELTPRQQLERAFAELRAQPTDSLKQRAFFQAYPEYFIGMQTCFVLDRFSATKPLDYTAYFNAFQGLTFVSEVEKMTRLFSIMLGGYWDADAPSAHFGLMEELMRKDPRRAFALISKETESHQILFWQCYWQGPIKNTQQAQDLQLYSGVKGYERAKRIMSTAYRQFRGELPVCFPGDYLSGV
ncbi:hypothetical protein [Porphyromonas sp.]